MIAKRMNENGAGIKEECDFKGTEEVTLNFYGKVVWKKVKCFEKFTSYKKTKVIAPIY